MWICDIGMSLKVLRICHLRSENISLPTFGGNSTVPELQLKSNPISDHRDTFSNIRFNVFIWEKIKGGVTKHDFLVAPWLYLCIMPSARRLPHDTALPVLLRTLLYFLLHFSSWLFISVFFFMSLRLLAFLPSSTRSSACRIVIEISFRKNSA
jgi:hypothetical protein